MQTSLARRQRHRRAKYGSNRSGGGAGNKIAAVLPLFLLGMFFTSSLVGVGAAVEIYSKYSSDLTDPVVALNNIDFDQ
jgi:hypothetical protein